MGELISVDFAEVAEQEVPTYWVAIMSGIYRHEFLGLFSSQSLAGAAAINFFAAEGDHYHEVEIIPLALDKALEVVSSGRQASVLEPDTYMLSPSSRG